MLGKSLDLVSEIVRGVCAPGPTHFRLNVKGKIMLRKYALLTALIAATLVGTAEWAHAQQTPPGRDSQDGNGGRFDRGERGRGEGRRGRRGPGRGFDMDGFYNRITEELGLDEDQVAQLNEIRAAQNERMEQFRQRRQAIRQAEEAGDTDEAERLREEMRGEFERNVGRRGFMQESIESIESILNEDQKAQFSEMRENMRSEREERMREGFERRYEQIAEDLDLDDEQRAVLQDIKVAQIEQMEQFRARWEAVREAYESGDEARGDELREALVAEMRESGGPRQFMNQVWDELDPVLTDEQRTLAQDLRERRGRRGRDRRENGDEESNSVSRDGADQGGDDLTQTLNMSDEQKADYAALVEAHKQLSKATANEMRSIRQRIEAAEAEGDTEGAAKLKEHLAQLDSQAKAQKEAFNEELAGMLTPAQQETLAEYRADQQVAEELNDIPADLRTVLRAAMRLKLERSQKQQIRDLTKEAKKDLRTARATDRKNRDRERTAEKALADQYKARIRSILTTEQSQKYTENLETMTPRRSRDRSRARGI